MREVAVSFMLARDGDCMYMKFLVFILSVYILGAARS